MSNTKSRRPGKDSHRSFAARLASLIPHRGKSSFANTLGVSPNLITELTKGRSKPSYELLEKIKTQTGCDLNWLVTGRTTPGSSLPPHSDVPPRASDLVIDLESRVDELERQNAMLQERPVISDTAVRVISLAEWRREAQSLGEAGYYVGVPLYEDPIAAGDPTTGSDEVDDIAVIHHSYLPHPAETVCLRVSGESMSPVIRDGALVAIDRALRTPDAIHNHIALVRVEETIDGLDLDGGLTLKHCRIAADILYLQPLNPDRQAYPCRQIHPSQHSIIGRAVWMWQAL